MISCKIIDKGFAHVDSMCWKWKPKHIEWYRGNIYYNKCFFTDTDIPNAEYVDCKQKIAIILEPPTINRAMNEIDYFDYIKNNHDKFDYILTPYKDMIHLNPKKFLYYHQSFPWIPKEDQKIYPKNKLLSIISSPKRVTLGHRLRHDVIHTYYNKFKFDVYGCGYMPFKEHKTDFLKDYYYSVCIMNSNLNGYFTEALGDCFATGTIPIFWGTKSVSDIYNTDGMIFFERLEDLNEIIPSLNENYYNSKIKAIEENFNIATQYTTHEDFIYEKYPYIFLDN
jgi:hypothetical protein